MQPQAVADVIEAEGMAQLREQHGHHMARGGERPGLDAVLSFQAVDEFRGYVLDNLPEYGKVVFLGIHDVSLCFFVETKDSMDSRLLYLRKPCVYGSHTGILESLLQNKDTSSLKLHERMPFLKSYGIAVDFL